MPDRTGTARNACIAAQWLARMGTAMRASLALGERNAGMSTYCTSSRSTVWRRWLQRARTGSARNACIAPHHAGEDRHCAQCLHCVRNGSSRWDRQCALRCAGERNARTSSCWHCTPIHRLATVATTCEDRHCAQCLHCPASCWMGQAVRDSLMLANAMLGRAVVGTSADPPSGDGGYFASGRRWRACRIGSCLAPSPCWAAMQCSWAEHSCYRKIDH